LPPIHDLIRGDIICSKCGLVRSERLVDDSHEERRIYTADEANSRARTGALVQPTIPNIALMTVIDQSGPMSDQMRRAAKWDSRMDWTTRNLLAAGSEIKRIATNLQMGRSIHETAYKVYEKALEADLLRGRSINGMACVCLYIAARQLGYPITRHTLLRETQTSRNDFKRCYNIAVSVLSLRVPQIDPSLLLARQCSDLELPHAVEHLALRIINLWKETETCSGKKMPAVTAAALYIAANNQGFKISQKCVAGAFGITEVTLRDRQNEMRRLIAAAAAKHRQTQE
jgi:transcription initiation factor TFIIB